MEGRLCGEKVLHQRKMHQFYITGVGRFSTLKDSFVLMGNGKVRRTMRGA